MAGDSTPRRGGARATPPRGAERVRRCARWLGLDRNPLRRGVDRLRAAGRLLLLSLLVVVPAAGAGAGWLTMSAGAAAARAHAAVTHQARAVLLRPASGTAAPDLGLAGQTWVTARWTTPAGRARTGQIIAPAGAAMGSSVTIWIDEAGSITTPPDGRRVILGEAISVGVTAAVALATALLIGWRLLTGLLDRRCLAAWDEEWRTVGPGWRLGAR